jgi:hypothetical protein
VSLGVCRNIGLVMSRLASVVPENQLFRDEGSIVTVAPPSKLTDVAVSSILRELEARLARNVRHVLIFDLSRTGTPTPVQRQLLAAHMKKNRELIRRNVQALGVVVPSSLLRGVLTAIFWIEAPPVPHLIFGTATEAATWARAQMRSMRGQ